ncbi:MAG: PHP domain-containing protein [Pseudomonadota bacterium]|nr:PHP domain-containing protein [Pseudomonadota bacterium]
MITVDLHLHTNYSDGSLPLSKLIDLCGESGLDAIAITDHLCATDGLPGKVAKYLNLTLSEKNWNDYIGAIEKERNRAWREYKMLVYTGVEFTRNTFFHGRNAHLLAIDLKEFVSPNQSEEKWLIEARQQGAVTVAAHPMKVLDCSTQTYYLLKNQAQFAPLIDVWEVANGRTFWPEMLNTPYALSAASDFHHKIKWEGWRTQIECEKDPQAILESIKNPQQNRSFVYINGHCSQVSQEIFHMVSNKGGPNDPRCVDDSLHNNRRFGYVTPFSVAGNYS